MQTEESVARFKAAAAMFYALEDTSSEWDLFAALSTCNEARWNRRWSARARDKFFTVLLCHLRLRPAAHVGLWYKRFADWRTHIDVYFNLERDSTGKPLSAFGTERLELLFSYLNILDTKFGMLLAVNSLMLASFGVALNNVPKLIAIFHFKIWRHKELSFFCEYISRFVLDATLVFVICCCLFNIWHALRGFRRIVWGDLNEFVNDPVAGEDMHVDMLIISIARRTNTFRIIAEVTRFIYKGFIVFAFVAFLMLSARYTLDLRARYYAYEEQKQPQSAPRLPQNALPAASQNPTSSPPARP